MYLFDPGLERTDFGPAKYVEPQFAYLNRSARAEAGHIRALLSSWFAHYPDPHKAELAARFQSPDSVHHYSAFFELYLHELLRLAGYIIEVHPAVPASDRRPDFRVSRAGELSFYLEAIVAMNKSAEELAAESRLSQVMDAVNEVRTPNFFVGLDMHGPPPTPVPGRRLRAAVEQFLNGLDPDEMAAVLRSGGLSALPRGTFEHEGWKIEFYPLARSPKARGDMSLRPLGVHGPAFAWVDDRTALREAIVKKASRYGDLSEPYMVAVNAIDQHLDFIDVMEALFGREQYVIYPDTAGRSIEPEMERARDGALVSKRGPSNTRVSAVLVVSSLLPWSVGVHSPTIYHNPWAKQPCPDALRELPSAHPADNQMSVRPGREFRDLAGLPPAWPAVPTSGR